MFMKTIHSIHAGKGFPPIFVEVLPRFEEPHGVNPCSTPFGSNSGSNRVSCPPPIPPNQWEIHAAHEDYRGNCWPPWTSHNIFKSAIDVNGDVQVLPDQEEYTRLYEYTIQEGEGHGDQCDDYDNTNGMEGKITHEPHHETPNVDEAAPRPNAVGQSKSRSEHTPPNANVAGTLTVVSTPSVSQQSRTSLTVGTSGKPDTSNEIKVGQLYMSKKELKLKLSVYAMRNNFEYKVKKSTTDRYEVACLDDNCKWRLRATTIKDGDWFMVRCFIDTHNCNVDVVHRDHRQASSEILGECIKFKYAGSSSDYKPNAIRRDIQFEYGINISYEKAWRAKECALQALWGSAEESFALLPSYCHAIESTNPGTITAICTDDNNCFRFFFIAIGACIRGFLTCMRPVIAVDATVLKHKFKGYLYTASTMDGNGQIYPIAFGVGPGETDEAYIWFFDRLKEAIGEPSALVFITDRHKSLQKALSVVFPSAMHCLCIHHLGQNLVQKHFKPTDVVQASFYLAAKAYLVHDFEVYMQQIENCNPTAAQYLHDADPKKWSRAHCPRRRYNIMTTNISESLNSVLRDVRCRPIVPMIDQIRELIQKWFHERRTAASDMPGPVTHDVEQELKLRRELCLRLNVTPVNFYEFRVTGPPFEAIVDLNAMTCSCRVFDLDQYPCIHALAACRDRNVSCYSKCSRYYTVDTLINAYAESIYPVGDKKFWNTPPEIASRIILPPDMTSRPAGRPRKSRIQSAIEGTNQRRCGRCKQYGHNRQTCKNPIPLHRNPTT